jgi:DNA end-binding protein Ku
MLRQKQAGFKPPKTKEKPAAPNVVNLMDALRQSIAAGRRTPAAEKAAPAPKAEKPAPKKGKKQAAGQREMLLPIEGNKKTKEQKKPAAKPATGRQRKAG